MHLPRRTPFVVSVPQTLLLEDFLKSLTYSISDAVELLVDLLVKHENDALGWKGTNRRQAYTFLDLGINIKDGQETNLWNIFSCTQANNGM